MVHHNRMRMQHQTIQVARLSLVALLPTFNAAQPYLSVTNPSGIAALSNAAQANFNDDTNFKDGANGANFNNDDNEAIAQIAANDQIERLNTLDSDEDDVIANATSTNAATTNTIDEESNDTTSNKSGQSMAIGIPDPAQRETDKVATSARKKTKGGTNAATKKRAIQIRPGRRVAIRADKMRNRVKPGHPGYNIVDAKKNSYNFHGTVTSKKMGNNMYNVRVDDLPTANQIVDLPRQYMRVLEDGEEEKECDHGQDKEKDTTDDCHGKGPTKKPDHPEKASVNAFLSLSPAEQKVATTYVHRHGKDGKEKVVWEILGDDEQITQDAMDPELIKQSPFKKDIPWDADRKNVDYNKIFFDDFLPDLSGKAALLDKWMSDIRCPIYATAKTANIKFNRPDDDDPDCLVSCYIII